jgi:hypothetical protein
LRLRRCVFANLRLGLATVNHRLCLTEFIPLRPVVAPRIQTEIRAFYERGDFAVPLQVAANASPGPPLPPIPRAGAATLPTNAAHRGATSLRSYRPIPLGILTGLSLLRDAFTLLYCSTWER